jgi:hypothetical protein
MYRDGSLILSDAAVVCEACGRRGRYRDANVTNLLPTLADCPKARSVSIHDTCTARYPVL